MSRSRSATFFAFALLLPALASDEVERRDLVHLREERHRRDADVPPIGRDDRGGLETGALGERRDLRPVADRPAAEERQAVLVGHGHRQGEVMGGRGAAQAGDLLGFAGCSGQCTGPHLHFEIRANSTKQFQDGTPVDGLAFMLARGVDIEKGVETANGGIVG